MAEHCKKLLARRATSGSCLRKRSTGSALNQRVMIGLVIGVRSVEVRDGRRHTMREKLVMRTVEGE